MGPSPGVSKNYKRRRSRSKSREKYRTGRPKIPKTSPSTSASKQIESDFSFVDYKRELNKIILYSNESNTVANSLDDFWVFLKKYEATLKKANKPVIDFIPKESQDSVQSYSKFNCINFTTAIKYVDIVSDDRDKRKLDKRFFEAFMNIVSIYVDFKNKQKFEKLRKLRQAQKDLPVAKYRYISIYYY